MNFDSLADGIYGAGVAFEGFLDRMNQIVNPKEAAAMRSTDALFGVTKPDSAREGLYDRNTGRQLPQDTGADVLAGRAGDRYVGQGQSFTDPYMAAMGAITKAQAGMEVGQEVTLSDDQIKMLEGLGYKIKQLY